MKGLITFLYYEDLEKATRFYEKVMGFELAIDQGWSKIYRIMNGSYIGLVDEKHGYHKASPTKPVVICLNVFDVEAWYSYLEEKGVDTLNKPTYSKELKIRAFLLLDPEGYLIEIQESI